MVPRRRIHAILPAQPGTRAVFIGEREPARTESRPVVCWALCEELPEVAVVGIDAPSTGATFVVAMVAHLLEARLLFADSLARFLGIATSDEGEIDWPRVLAARARTDATIINRVEEVAEEIDRALTTRPPALAPEDEKPKP